MLLIKKIKYVQQNDEELGEEKKKNEMNSN
jgi:hypothetical protein